MEGISATLCIIILKNLIIFFCLIKIFQIRLNFFFPPKKTVHKIKAFFFYPGASDIPKDIYKKIYLVFQFAVAHYPNQALPE